MTELIYATNATLDGFIADEQGGFDWLPVDDELFAAHTDLMRSVGTLLYGRRLYKVMAVWETDAQLAAHSAPFTEFAAAWRAPNKVVYSTTLTAASTSNTRIEPDFDAAALEDRWCELLISVLLQHRPDGPVRSHPHTAIDGPGRRQARDGHALQPAR